MIMAPGPDKQFNGNSNIVLDFDLDKQCESPMFRPSIDCLFVPHNKGDHFTSSLMSSDVILKNL